MPEAYDRVASNSACWCLKSGRDARHPQKQFFAAERARRIFPLPTSHFPLPLFSFVRDAPDRAGTIVAHQKGSIFRDGDSDRPAPDFAIRSNEAGEEILVFA